jgi:hypothetical protein
MKARQSHMATDTERQGEWARLAEDAWRRGSDEAAAGQLDEAMRWLDRASRLAASDQTIKLTLAMVCLARKDARALTLFQEIAPRQDVREVWLGLAASRRLTGDHAGAAAALGKALARTAVCPDCASVADAIAREAGEAGWCGLSSEGALRIGLTDPASRPHVLLDGRGLRLPGGRCPAALPLPPRWKAARDLRLELAGRPLIGSPIDLGAIRRVEGFVESWAAGLRGWA